MNFESINYSDFEVKTPYPEITNTQKDEKIIPYLIDSYAGGKSELTAITQYSYQSFITKPNKNYIGLSEILIRIAMKEMHHLEILSQIIISQGVNPKFCKYIDNNYNICQSWSTKDVRYITDVKEFIEYNIKLEEGAIREYTEIVNTATNPNIAEIISRIIQDEESHIEIFNKILEIIENNN